MATPEIVTEADSLKDINAGQTAAINRVDDRVDTVVGQLAPVLSGSAASPWCGRTRSATGAGMNAIR